MGQEGTGQEETGRVTAGTVGKREQPTLSSSCPTLLHAKRQYPATHHFPQEAHRGFLSLDEFPGAG